MLVWIAAAAAGDAGPTAPARYERVSALPERGAGAVLVRVHGFEVPALGAAVLALHPSAPVPSALRAEGVPLGRSERTWRVPCAPGEDAVVTAARWADHPAVRGASPDLLRPRAPMVVDVDDPEIGAQWYLELLDFEALYTESAGDPAVRVAVIDGPIDIDHLDLAAGVDAPYDALADDDDPRPDCGLGADCDSHGTSSAGIVTARGDNGIDIIGLCSECTLIPIQLLGDETTLAADVASFEHAIDAGAAVINNSWGFIGAYPAPEPLAEVIERAQIEGRGGLGALVVFAAGNDDRRLFQDELTGLPGVITVSATDRYGFPTNYTNTGPTIDLSAPSATVSLQAGGGLTTTFGGTSAAAPVVSGVAGWALSVRPDLTSDALGELLVETARPQNEDGSHDERFGWGHLDPLALKAALLGEVADDTDSEAPKPCGCASRAGSPWLALFGLLALSRRRAAGAR